MEQNSLSVLAIACSIASLATALVVLLRSTPQRVRKAAFDALQIAEEGQNAIRINVNQIVTFMEEVTRERASAAADLEEAERKRRQAAAKLSKVKAANGGEDGPAPKSLREMLDSLPVGDPQRLKLLRHAKMSMDDA